MHESYLRENNKTLLVADALLPKTESETQPVEVKYAILADDLKEYWRRGMGIQIAQLYELVIPGLILSKHIFQGLKRNLYCDDKNDADTSKIIYSRTPAFDVMLDRRSPNNPTVIKITAPKDKVFVVIISPNVRHRTEYPSVTGWLDRWNWVQEDPGLQEAPINWLDRYEKKLYTRS